MRYLIRYVRPNVGPVVGSSRTFSGEYANDRNALRFMDRTLQGLAHFPAGEYLVETWPPSWSTIPTRTVGTLTKES